MAHPWSTRLVTSLAISGGGAALSWAGVSYLTSLSSTALRTSDQLVATAAVGLGVLVTAWYCTTGLMTAICLLIRSSGRVWAAGEHVVRRTGAPIARRLVVAGAGAAIAAGTALSPALATPSEAPPGGEVHLSWSPTDGAGEGRERRSLTASDEPIDSTTSEGGIGAADRHTVTAGDTLWDIAAERLGPAATNSAIAQEWPRWHHANREVIGPDPDLIHPGQQLTAPQERAS